MIKFSSKKFLFLGFLCGVFLFFGLAQKSFAYDNDTHFWLTYYLAVKAGFTPIQATQIASANISVDLDNDTDPVIPQPQTILDLRHLNAHFQIVRRKLHALPAKWRINQLSKQEYDLWWDPSIEEKVEVNRIATDLVNERKDEFWKETLEKGKNPGVFLHYLQDTFAHRQFKSYVGHAGYYYVDFLATDQPKAEEMAFTTYKYLRAFHETNFGKKAFAMVDSVESSTIDAGIQNEIKTVLGEFYRVNPSPGIKSSPLKTAWDNLDVEVQRKKHKRPPASYLGAVLKILKENPAPNSSKARNIVLGNLQPGEYTPLIWKYNLRKSGNNEGKFSSTAYEYRKIYEDSDMNAFTSRLELGNRRRKTYQNPNQNQCLAFDLVDKSVIVIPLCNPE